MNTELRERLLYYAAKAAKICYPQQYVEGGRVWSPLEDDGDAFRLAAALGFIIDFMAYESAAQARLDIVQRAAYCGEHM